MEPVKHAHCQTRAHGQPHAHLDCASTCPCFQGYACWPHAPQGGNTCDGTCTHRTGQAAIPCRYHGGGIQRTPHHGPSGRPENTTRGCHNRRHAPAALRRPGVVCGRTTFPHALIQTNSCLIIACGWLLAEFGLIQAVQGVKGIQCLLFKGCHGPFNGLCFVKGLFPC